MFPTRSFSLRRAIAWPLLLGIACCFFGVSDSVAAGPTVTAVLDNSSTVVGQPVQLQIKVTGSASARPPGEISAEGLEIRHTGQSQLLEGRNFQFTYSFMYNYTVMPLKAGTFKIPGFPIKFSDAPPDPELDRVAAADEVVAGVEAERDRLRIERSSQPFDLRRCLDEGPGGGMERDPGAGRARLGRDRPEELDEGGPAGVGQLRGVGIGGAGRLVTGLQRGADGAALPGLPAAGGDAGRAGRHRPRGAVAR